LKPPALHAALAQSVALRVCTPAVRGSTPRRSSTSTEQQVTKSAERFGNAGRPASVSEGFTYSLDAQLRSRQPASIRTAMELTKVWAENKKAITTTALVVVVGMLLIKFFDIIFWGAFVIAIAVAAVLAWNHLAKKHGGIDGMWKAFRKEVGIGE
jgi:hypothetical protein